MGQDEVLREIRKNGSITSEELAEKLDINYRTVRANLNRLYEWGLVDYEYGEENITEVYSLTERGKKV